MEDLEYESKFSEMQKYIPFLDRVIEKLKNSDQDKPRKAQLEKMQTLHSLLHNRDKKLKIETLLKCETVLKKLYAKIEKSDDVIPSNPPSNSTNTNISSNAAKKVITASSPATATATQTAQRAYSTKNKFVPNRNLIEIHTCPASPTHLGEEDFRPPVEIPTERRSSPVKLVSNHPRWDQTKSSKEPMEEHTRPPISSAVRFPNPSTDGYNSSNTTSLHKFTETPKNSRWSDPRDRTRDISPASSSSYHRSSASFSSNRSHSQKRNESKYSSEEENWDEPEEEPLPKPKPDLRPTPPISTSSSYSSHKDSKSTHHHRHNDNKSYMSQIEHAPLPQSPPPAFPPLPDTSHYKDVFQNRIYHDTIYKYKTPEAFSSFMNPSPPEPRMQKHSGSNIFNRLGEKVDEGFENFRIQVKNDKIKAKAPNLPISQTLPPPPPPPLLISTKPIGEVLKSPPLSADDIDDLLNESLEAAMEKQNKGKSNDCTKKDHKVHSLDAVRKKLALISRPPSPPHLESPTRADNKAEEPFYRRGHTPVKKPIEVVQQNKSEPKTGPEESITPALPPSKSFPLPSPKSPPNAMDAVVERLALKYNPHKRRESVSIERNFQLQTEKINTPPLAMKDSVDSLGHRSKQSSHRESMVSPIHIVDPRVSKKIVGNIQPLMSLPISPVPNVLPTINHFDPRLRNTLPLNKDLIPFTVPKPFAPIPSLLDLHINIPLHPNSVPKPSLPTYNAPSPNLNPNRVDPRTQKTSKTYVDKFNPERNDKTERMKYLESKKNKPPEPKTYGEYRQSRCRQQIEEVDGKAVNTTESISTPAAPSLQTIVPSTLDKMYRSADYGKDITGSIQGFKIPKKPKPEVAKTPDPKKDDHETKSVEESKNESASIVEQAVKAPQKPQEDLTKKCVDDQFENAKKLEESKKNNEMPKQKEKPIEKFKQNDNNAKKAQDVETKKPVITESYKKKKTTTKSNVTENTVIEVEPAANKILKISAVVETMKQTQEINTQTPPTIETKASESESDGLKSKPQSPDSLDVSITESRLVIDEGESPIKSKDDKTIIIDDSDDSPEPRIIRPRRLLNKKNVIKDNTPPPEVGTKETPPDNDVEKELIEPEKEEVKPRRISTRRSTILMKEPSEQIEIRKSESPSQIRARRRSASDIFSPTTDNSVVSTQNIISGKRKTRASINFNEKNTKKTPTPKTITSTISPPSITQTPKTRAAKAAESKVGAKKRNSVSAEQRKEDIEKKNSEDGQICAVSSTTEGPHNEPAIITDTSASPEEPSSSNATDPSKTPDRIVDADNKKKQEFLEGFLMSIVDPTTNKDRIIDMLKSVLDDKKLQQVKEILYSPEKSESKNDKKEEEEEHQEQSKPRVTRTKKNELDRLNEDIRDMFICQGVVTATGRRMCTLAKATSKKTSVQPKKKKVVQPKPNKSPVTTQPASSPSKRRMRKAKVLISPLNIRALRSRNLKGRSPKMPVLEPNTPIKLSGDQAKNRKSDEEIEEVTETKSSKNKPEFKVSNKPIKLTGYQGKNRKSEEEFEEIIATKSSKNKPEFKVLKKPRKHSGDQGENRKSEEEFEEITETKSSKKKAEIKVLKKDLKKRPGPKCKRHISISSDSSDDDIELVYLKNKIKRKDEMKIEVEKSRESKAEKIDKKTTEIVMKVNLTKEENYKKTTEKAMKVNLTKEETKKDEAKKEQSEKEKTKKQETKKEETKKEETKKEETKKEETKKEETKKEETKKEETKKEQTKKDIDEKEIGTIKECKSTADVSYEKPKHKADILLKNTNPEFHSKSAYSNCCVICKERARFIAPHYLTAHNDSEVYTSRLPADVLEDMKLNIGNRALYAIPKKPQIAFNYICPFCDFQSTHSLRGWMEHFTIHTGEYAHKCSNCFKAMNGCTHMTDHIKKFCPDAKKINRDPINLRGNAVLGYVCHLCNFVQMLRGGVIRHLKVHHNLEDAESIAGIIEVKLIDSAGVIAKKEENKGNLSIPELPHSSKEKTYVITVPDDSPTKPNESCMLDSDEEDPLRLPEKDDVIVFGSSSNAIPTFADKPTEKKVTDDDNEKSGKGSTMSMDSNKEAFLPRDLVSPSAAALTVHSKSITTDEIIDLDSSANAVSKLTDKPAAATGSQINVPEKPGQDSSSIAINSNIEVFLPRDLASPTCLVLTERLKSIEKDDANASDSSVNKTKPTAKKITIAEKLSQRFKNIEKQNIVEEDATADNCQNEKDIHEVSLSVSSHVEMEIPETPSTSEKTCQLPLNSPMSTQSLNESDNLIIDEQIQNDSLTRDDYCSESDEGNENEEDDNDNWEDIEITETTKGGSQKDKNKNKSIFQTLSRLYASIAPKKSSKKTKDKEKKKVGETLERSEKTAEKSATEKPSSIKPVSDEILDPLLTALSKPTQQQQRILNLSEFLPDSPGDSLDMLLTSNFSCLDGDGNSFPHLDLNDLDSSIFPLPEEQENIQDAIALATDMDHIKYDVLGNPLSMGLKPQQQQSASSLQPSSIQKIGNFGFSLYDNSFKYYCMVKSCAFLFSDHPDGLQNHFLLDHPSLKWNGYCHTCKMQVGYGDCREMTHMLDVHSRIRSEDSGDKPRIKFRRLTGDILSTDKPNIENLSNEVLFSPIVNAPCQVPPSQAGTSHFGTSHIGTSHTETSHVGTSRVGPSHVGTSHVGTSHVGTSHVGTSHVGTSHVGPSRIETSRVGTSHGGPSQIAPSHNAPSHTVPSHTIPSHTVSHNPPISHSRELSLSTMLQSEPKAMIPPKAPPKLDMDIPLFKNVSREFTITNVAEGVTDNDLLNLVFKQADSAPGGIQISQVISLNAGGKSVSPIPMTQISERVTSSERRNSPSLKEISSSIRETEKQSPRASPKPNPIISSITITQQRNSPIPKNPTPKQSAFICCVNKCCFVTNIRSAMNEHILAHIRCDNNREALKCHVCSFIGQDTNHYFNHMTQAHSRYDAVATSCASTVELTQKIQDILRTTSKQNQPNEKEQTSQAPAPTPPPPAPAEEKTTKERDISFPNRLRKIAEEIVAATGLPEEQVWRCIFYPQCEFAVTEKDFQTHLATHTNIVPTSFPSIPPGSSLHCPHCPVNYYRPAVLKAHMKVHSRHQYFCHVCSCTTFGSFQQVQKHFSDLHSVTGMPRTRNLIPEEKSNNPTFLIASETELTSMELIQFGEKLIVDWERKKAINKTHFKPNEQNLLPIQPIFNNQVYCSVCNYKTKVRTNMFRHLQLHNQDVDVGSVDPVNPVPCLEKNEKHFDKMLNLACSSNTGSSMKPKESVKIPAFVPDMRRYVCGHPGCKYLTITDQMLRSHLNALHGQEKGYLCPHCQEEICKKNMCTERVVQHLKFHGSKMYQCSECDYFHYTKHVVERHVNEKHASVPFVNLLTYDRSENETKKSTQLVPGRNVTSSHSTSSECDAAAESPASSNTPPNTKMKWECALCKHQTATWNQMISHANSMHNAKHQYHCVHCTFGSAHLAHIMDHIDTKHPSKIREAKYVFYKINETLQDKAADTRPLWSRNDPKRVRSIRGILMENEEDAERTKNSLSRAGVDFDDEDEEIIVPVSDSDSSVIPGGLACFHCNFTSVEMSSLSSHWKAKHWHEKNFEMVPRIPFFFRIHTVLKCPLCVHVGDQLTLKIHLINVHGQRNFCAADPNVPNTCGHCPFVYPTKRLDVLTNHYLREHKPTDAKNLSSGLLKNLLALGECQVYMQCYFCAEICADKTAIIEHERERHKNSNFRYKQIKDEVIYRCGMCQYSSTNELATLRHMIDHFAGFNICHFCKNVQSSFNSYMQHCYAFHMKGLTNFKEIYDFDKISSFLGQMLLIFPNGLIAAKRNLLDTQYGNTERIQAMYDEICKKALEPPIPPLCMGRLLAKKSIEASTLLPPPPMTVTAKRIAKRRSTVAMGGCERGLLSSFLVPSEPQKIKKRKSSICGDFIQPTAPLFSTITANSNNIIDSPAERCEVAESKSSEPQGFSFYGQKPEPIDLSKIYTHIAIGDKYAPVSVKKFSLLFKINTKVLVEPMDHRNFQAKKRSPTFSRPCPASKKKKFA